MATNFGKLNFATAFNPTSAFPLDARQYFESYDSASSAATTAEEAGSSNTVYHFGMTVAVVEDNKATLYIIQPKTTGTGGELVEVGSKTLGDDKTIVLENGVLSLKDFGKFYYKYIAETETTAAHWEKVSGWKDGLQLQPTTEAGQSVLAWHEISSVVDGKLNVVSGVEFSELVEFEKENVSSQTIKENKDGIEQLNHDLGGVKSYTYLQPATYGASSEVDIPAEVVAAEKYIKFEALSLRSWDNAVGRLDIKANRAISISAETNDAEEIFKTDTDITLYQTGLTSDDADNVYGYDAVYFASKIIERHCTLVSISQLINLYNYWTYDSNNARIRIPLAAIRTLNDNVAIPSSNAYRTINLDAGSDYRARFKVEISKAPSDQLGYLRITDLSGALTSKASWKTYFDGITSTFNIVCRADKIVNDSSYALHITTTNQYLPESLEHNYVVTMADELSIPTIQVSYLNKLDLIYTKDQCDNKFATKTALSKKQDALTAGDNITIIDEVISTTGLVTSSEFSSQISALQNITANLESRIEALEARPMLAGAEPYNDIY